MAKITISIIKTLIIRREREAFSKAINLYNNNNNLYDLDTVLNICNLYNLYNRSTNEHKRLATQI